MRTFRWVLFLVIVFGVTGCDHATKSLASSILPDGQSQSLISGMLSLEQTRNTDTAFSLLSRVMPVGPRLLLLKVTATFGLFFVLWLVSKRFTVAGITERCALGLILGGALGNTIDRWRWGYVVDFIHFEHWPIFNVADMALSLGVGLLLLSSIRLCASRAVKERA